MTVKMMDGNLEKHLQWVQRLKRQCEEQGETISDTIYDGILLNSVPEDFKIAVSILELQDKLTPASIINRLLEESRKNAPEGAKPGIALITQKASESKSSSKKKSTNKEQCSHCNKKGHSISKCWELHPELRPKKSTDPKTSAKLAFSMMAKAVGKVKCSRSPRHRWYADSGSSYHFCAYKDLFE